MDQKKTLFCSPGRHNFGKIILREIVMMDKLYGHQRGYMECQNKNCSLVVERKREVWVDYGGRIMASGPWQEDSKFKAVLKHPPQP